METFIKIYKLDKLICKNLIKYYNKNKEYKAQGRCYSETGIDKNVKDSTDVAFFNPSNDVAITSFFKELSKCAQNYIDTYFLSGRFKTSMLNLIQHYKPRQGFKVWHYENNGEAVNRVLVYMLYLNTLKNGGTEWDFQKVKLNAIEGDLVIWPASFTHRHKGVISNDQEKYIATGWLESV